jgi:hypothetical protein
MGVFCFHCFSKNVAEQQQQQRCNLIVSDCIERRQIDLIDYYAPPPNFVQPTILSQRSSSKSTHDEKEMQATTTTTTTTANESRASAATTTTATTTTSNTEQVKSSVAYKSDETTLLDTSEQLRSKRYRWVSRQLPLAMIPGKELVKVEMKAGVEHTNKQVAAIQHQISE